MKWVRLAPSRVRGPECEKGDSERGSSESTLQAQIDRARAKKGGIRFQSAKSRPCTSTRFAGNPRVLRIKSLVISFQARLQKSYKSRSHVEICVIKEKLLVIHTQKYLFEFCKVINSDANPFEREI